MPAVPEYFFMGIKPGEVDYDEVALYIHLKTICERKIAYADPAAY